MPQTSTDRHSLLHTITSLAQCNHNLSLLDAGPPLHQITSQTIVNHNTISGIHSTYFIYPHKPVEGYPSEASSVDTHYEQQLISSWKARNGDKVTKTPVDIMDQPLLSQNIDINLENAGFKVVMKKKTSFQQVA